MPLSVFFIVCIIAYEPSFVNRNQKYFYNKFYVNKTISIFGFAISSNLVRFHCKIFAICTISVRSICANGDGISYIMVLLALISGML